MSFIDFIFDLDNYAFTGSIILAILIILLESTMSFIGLGISEMIDSMIPDFEQEVYDENDMSFSILLIKFFMWIRLKRIPSIVLLVSLLFTFGFIGLILQIILLNLTGILWFSFLILFPTIVFSILILRGLGNIIEKFLPYYK